MAGDELDIAGLRVILDADLPPGTAVIRDRATGAVLGAMIETTDGWRRVEMPPTIEWPGLPDGIS